MDPSITLDVTVHLLKDFFYVLTFGRDKKKCAVHLLLQYLFNYFRDVSTASGRPSRRDQLSSTEAAGGGRGRGQTSRSYAGSPTQQYPPPGGPLGRGNVPSSISSSAFTVGTSKYNTARYV